MPPAAFSVFYLLGLIRGHWDLKKTTLDYRDDELRQVNMGIAIVTPIQDVIAVLNGDELRSRRRISDREVAKLLKVSEK